MADKVVKLASESGGGVVSLESQKEQKINVAKESTGGAVNLQAQAQRTDPYSLDWATKVVRPISYFVLILLAVVMLIPFWEIILLAPTGLRIENLPAGTTPDQAAAAIKAAAQDAMAQRSKDLLDWAKTILPSVVGFGSAMMGYYFGTRSTEAGTKPGSEPDDHTTPEPPETAPGETKAAEAGPEPTPPEPKPAETNAAAGGTLDLRS